MGIEGHAARLPEGRESWVRHELFSKPEEPVAAYGISVDKALLVLKMDILQEPQILKHHEFDAEVLGLSELLALALRATPESRKSSLSAVRSTRVCALATWVFWRISQPTNKSDMTTPVKPTTSRRALQR